MSRKFSFDRHRAADPHCTCNDCVTYHAQQQRDAIAAATCENCGATAADVKARQNDARQCDACWRDALAFGHRHGLHVNEDGAPIAVEGCPTCIPPLTITEQNDRFRAQVLRLGSFTVAGLPGRIVMTRGIAMVEPERLMRILAAVVRFDTFTPANDPHREHDLGMFEDDGDRIMWKIDYYADASMTFGAEDARDSYRVLTVMFANEY